MTTALNFQTLIKTSATRRAFGRAVQRARVDLDMTVRDLAIEAETTADDIADVETGQCELIGIMRRVALVCGIEAEEIE